MSELMRRIERAGSGIAPAWGDAEIERGIREVAGKRRRRARALIGAAALTCCVAGIVAVRLILPVASAPEVSVTAAAPQLAAPASVAAARSIRLGDGSLVIPLDATSEVAIAEDSARRVEVLLERGRSRFEVTPSPARLFVVRAGAVSVSVLGTVFTVERVADRVGVTVERGRVRVDWKGGARVLDVGDDGWFPPLQAAAAPAVAPGSPSPSRRSVPSTAPSPARPDSSAWSPEQLLLAADNARLAGHSDEAIALLDRVVTQHAGDSRAHVAAFTLGRMFLAAPGRAADAARAFAQARALAPAGAFAEDALAREVEAWTKAGDTAQARASAGEYVRLYPAGRRLDQVKALGGLE